MNKSETVAFLAVARKNFDEAVTAEADLRKDGLEDLKFLKGGKEHWPESVWNERNIKGEERPCESVNKFPTLLHQITNDQRQNRPSIQVSPVGEGADTKVADIYRGMIRAIQRNSDAEIAIDTAFHGAAAAGWGYWRIGTEYESPDSFDQVLVWKRIRNAFTVYVDPAHQDPTTADKKWCFVTEMLDKTEAERQFPQIVGSSWESGAIGENSDAWVHGDKIRIADYWRVETKFRELVALRNGFVGFRDKLASEVEAQIEETKDLPEDQRFLMKARQAECKTVKCYKITAQHILKEYEWDDEIIPIVRCIGDELDIEGKVSLSGIIRHGKGPARIYNYGVNAEAERVGLSPKAPFIAAEGQIEGKTRMWKDANRRNFAVLTYKPIDVGGRLVPPPQRQQPVAADAGILALKEGASQDLLGTTGIRFDATKNERAMDESGIALEHLRRNTDLGAYHFPDNLARALKVTGGIFVRMIPKIYDTARVATIIREDGKEDHVLIDITQQKAVGKVKRGDKNYKSYNPTVGKYAVAVTIGPNFATKRREQSAGMMEFMKVAPHTAPIVDDLVAKVQDWEGADEIARRLAMTKPPGMLQPESMDLPPEAQALFGQMQQQIQQLSQEREQMMAALTEKDTEHAIEVHKIELDYDAKMQKIAADMESKLVDHIHERMAATEQQIMGFAQLHQQAQQAAQAPTQ